MAAAAAAVVLVLVLMLMLVLVGLDKRRSCSSEEEEGEEPRLDEDSERKRLGLMGAMKRRAEGSHNGFIQVLFRLCEANASRRAKVQ